MRRTSYYHFSNDWNNKTGIVTLSIRRAEDEDKEVFRVGFALTPPETKLNKTKAKKEAKTQMESNLCFLMVGRASTGTILDTARVVWGAAIQPCNSDANPDFPDWAKKLDLGTKCHHIR